MTQRHKVVSVLEAEMLPSDLTLLHVSPQGLTSSKSGVVRCFIGTPTPPWRIPSVMRSYSLASTMRKVLQMSKLLKRTSLLMYTRVYSLRTHHTAVQTKRNKRKK